MRQVKCPIRTLKLACMAWELLDLVQGEPQKTNIPDAKNNTINPVFFSAHAIFLSTA